MDPAIFNTRAQAAAAATGARYISQRRNTNIPPSLQAAAQAAEPSYTSRGHNRNIPPSLHAATEAAEASYTSGRHNRNTPRSVQGSAWGAMASYNNEEDVLSLMDSFDSLHVNPLDMRHSNARQNI
eukprot:85431-Pleurochrysis_carterae.AAC.1